MTSTETSSSCECDGNKNISITCPCGSHAGRPMFLPMMMAMPCWCGCCCNSGNDKDDDKDDDKDNGEDGTGAYPVGGVAFFPYLTQPPSEKWILCNGDRYRSGTYPEIDTFYDEHDVLYHADQEVSSNNAASAGITVVSSNAATDAYKVFQDSIAVDSSDCWVSANKTLSEQAPQWIGLSFKTQTPKFLGVELVARHSNDANVRRFPSRVRLLISNDGGVSKQSLTGNEIIELQDPGSDGIVRIKLDVTPTPASSFYLEIYDAHGTGVNQYAALARMHVLAQENNFVAPLITEAMGDPTGIWCIRVAE